eukprot:gene15310-18114_t
MEFLRWDEVSGSGAGISTESRNNTFVPQGDTTRPKEVGPGVSITQTQAWFDLIQHVEEINNTHLRDLLQDEERCASMFLAAPTANPYHVRQGDREDMKRMPKAISSGALDSHEDYSQSSLILDFSHQRVTQKTIELLLELAKAAKVPEKIAAMFRGEIINKTESRAVLHTALRAPRERVILDQGKNVVPEVHAVLDKIKRFSEQVRNGEFVGATGKALTDVVAIGIGGSFLGPLFVHTAFRTATDSVQEDATQLPPQKAAAGRRLRFLSNVDPVDIARALEGLNQETTLVVIVSKTFTTAETMLNARTVRQWIVSKLGEGPPWARTVSRHMVAVSTNLKLVAEFGIDPVNTFAFWDWVGGRYSVTSAVGVLPLALQYGFHNVQSFLEGACSVDDHFHNETLSQNLPVLLGMISVWNVSFLGHAARGILPYCQALAKLPSHIQQLSMESNGKGVDMEGNPLLCEAGEIDFGEPGTNGQHSFYQLIHQGRQIPCEFIGVVKSQHSVFMKGEPVSNHDELMCNFFAQPDALAYGKTEAELREQGVPEELIGHKTFSGNRPSLSILMQAVDPYSVGQLLALYEHRVAVQGFIWGINSFDQWGVELGKSLAGDMRKKMTSVRANGTWERDE